MVGLVLAVAALTLAAAEARAVLVPTGLVALAAAVAPAAPAALAGVLPPAVSVQ